MVNSGLIIFHVLYQREDDSLIIQVNIYLEDKDRVRDNFQKDEGDPIPYEAGGITHLLAITLKKQSRKKM